jgi:hypothetical protein
MHDVSLTSPTSGDFLKWNGTVWVNDTIDLGTDTTGNYVSDVTAGTGVTVTHTPGEGSSPSIAIGQAVASTDSPTFAGVTADNIQVGIAGANEIDTSTGNLTIDSAGGTVTIDDNLIVSGDLTVNGTTVTLNTETLNVEDNIVLLNSGVAGSPTLNAGIEVERGTSDNVSLRWNETTDKWQFTNDGTTYNDLGAGGAVVSDTPPTPPTEGQLWFESDSGKTFVYTDSSWVEVGGGIKGDTGAQGEPGLQGEPGPTGADGGWSTAQAINFQTGTSYFLESSDIGKLVILNNSDPVSVIVANGLGLAPGQRIDLMALGAGSVTVNTFGGGVFINQTPGRKLRDRYSAATLVCINFNDYVLVGDLSA